MKALGSRISLAVVGIGSVREIGSTRIWMF